MPEVAVAELIDEIQTGHDCDSTAKIQGSLQSSVKVGGKNVAVVGDAIEPHTILSGVSCVPHSSTINTGSSSVFIEGIAVARKGDSADMEQISTGSSTVFVGG